MIKTYVLFFILFCHSESWAQYSSTAEPTPEELRKIKINKLFASSPMMGPPVPLLTYEGRYDRDLQENKASFALPLYKNETDSVSLSFSGSQLHLNPSLQLNSSNYQIPPSLSKAEIGIQFNQKRPQFENWGIKATIGYAGDEPSSANQELTYSFMANYGYMSVDKKGFWNWMIYMSNNGPFINYFPIPGFVYIHKTVNFSGVFGFPILSLQWDLSPKIKYSVSVLAVNLQSEITYGNLDHFQIYTHYSVTQQSYLPHDRIDKKDRLTLQEQKASFGFRRPFADQLMLEVQSGYSYDRSFFMGNKLLNKSKGSKPLDPQWYSQLSLKYALSNKRIKQIK